MWRDGWDNAAIPVTNLPPPYQIITHEDRHVTLREVGLKAEEDMTEHLRTLEKVGQVFSNREIERRIQDVFWKIAFTRPDGVKEAAEIAADELQASLSEDPTEWTILLPISNLALEGSLTVGKSTFHPNSQLESVVILAAERLGRRPPLLDSLKKDFEGCSIAESKAVSVDLDQAKILAERDVLDALCVLRCLAAPAYRPDNKYIDFKGKIWAGTTGYAVLSSKQVSLQFTRIGYFMPFRIRDKHAQDPVFLKFNNLLQKGVAVRTVFDRRLITAIRAFGLALNETTDRDCFVTCITALEALMLEDHDPKKEALAERTAHLIGRNRENKREIYRRMKDLYAVRSDIVHGEERDLSDADVAYLIEIAQACILKSLEMTSGSPKVDDPLPWFEEQKFPSDS